MGDSLQGEVAPLARAQARPPAEMKRAGAEALFLLSGPLNVHILQSLREGPKGLIELRRAAGSPPQSTMRVYTRTLVEMGILERRGDGGAQPAIRYAIAPAGEGLLRAGETLQAWLDGSPDRPISLGSPAAKSAVRALAEGWSTNIVRALAAKPHTLTELSRMIPQTSYPSLERRLGAMRLTGQLEPHPGDGRGTPYRVTEWLRRAVVPVAAAAAWERRFVVDLTAPLGRLDIEAAFLLAIPLIELPEAASGRCRLAVELEGGASPGFAGVLIGVEEGRIVSCSSRLEGEADAIASGPPRDWFGALAGSAPDELQLAGNDVLGKAVVGALHTVAAERLRPSSLTR